MSYTEWYKQIIFGHYNFTRNNKWNCINSLTDLMQVVGKQEEHVRTHPTWSVTLLDLDGLISPWISSHLTRFQKLQTTFRSNVADSTNILYEKQTSRHVKIKQYEITRDHHFNPVSPRKSRTRKLLFVVAWYCIPIQALTRTHQTAWNTEMHGVCCWYLRVGCLFYLIEILIIWKLNSCSIDFTQNMEKKLTSREVKHKVHHRFVIFFNVYISCSLKISKG